MKGKVVTCMSCGRRWPVAVHDSLYLLIELSSRPCPHCEAYTLTITDDNSVEDALQDLSQRSRPSLCSRRLPALGQT
jgi:uncharacterized protein CbrC (UPF0167 family)